MATILIVLLAGMALTVTTLGIMYSVRTAQDKQVTVHAATHSQAGAWIAVEAIRQYLQTLDKDALDALAASAQLTFDIGDNKVIAHNFSLAAIAGDADNTHRLGTDISYQDVAARSTSTINVVYNVVPASTSGTQTNNPFNQTLNIYDDLNMTGGISILGGDVSNFNVDGSVNLSNASVTGINTLKATGDISINSAISVVTLYSNGDITLSGSATAGTASALGDITINSGGSQGTLNANGNIVITNGSTTTANAIGYITTNSGGTHGTFTAGKTIAVSNGTLGSANAVGDITISNWPTVTTSLSQGSVTCPSQYWSNFTNIQAGVTTHNCPTSTKITAPAAVSVSTMTALSEFTLTRPNVDAYQLKGSANYIFTYADGKIQVTVNSVNGITAGTYRIGKTKKDWNDKWGYLCSDLDSSGYCKTECAEQTNGSCTGSGASALQKICEGTWAGAECIAYSSNSKTWTLNGQSGNTVVAPGVLWFEGDLALQSGYFRNSVIATGSITTSGSDKVSAVNYNGYSLTCENTTFPNLYPTNFCDKSSASLISNSVGNIGLLAGGYVDGVFSGGVISLGASTEIFGSVIAGDTLLTSGSSTVHGYVTAVGQGSGTVNNWTGSLVIDLNNLPEDYTPGDIPDMTGSCDSDDCDTQTTWPGQAKVLWSRYL
ncbi:hypothetical protein [Pseudomonas sp. LRF_L74]|uniref:hypothetical protein n=1 Tax=Pseudomonas sp. LRF_L74 TaxID=3369422 RepID=UPI003F60EB46